MDGPALFGNDLFGEPIQQASRGKLADSFLVPPFSVLNAREGWWQERKAAWLALGIRSELGRGGQAGQKLTMSATIQALKPSADQAAKHAQRERERVDSSPGGRARPAMKLGKEGRTVRGDGYGKPIG